MTTHEKRNILNIISSLLVMGVYSFYLYNKLSTGGDPENIIKFWAMSFLILIPISIVTTIILNIVMAIIHGIVTGGEEMPELSDERDKSIELKSNRNGFWIFVLGFVGSMGTQILEMPVSAMFIGFYISGLASSLVSEISSLVYYRRGA